MKTKADIEKITKQEIPVSEYVPLAAHISENVIKLKSGGGYLAAWKMQGLSFETADPIDILAKKTQLNNLLSALGGGNIAVWTHRIRRQANDRLEAEFSNDFCRDFDNRYAESFDEYKMISTELYLTLVFKPDVTLAEKVSSKKKKSISEISTKQKEALDEMDMFCMQVEASLEPYDIKRLATYSKNDVVFSEMLNLYGYLINGVWEEIPVRTSGLANFIASSRLFFGDQNGLVQIHNVGVKRYAGMLDHQDYPSSSEPGMNNALFYGDYEFIETQSFAIKNKRDAISYLDKQMGRLQSAEDGGVDELNDMARAREEVKSGEIQMGQYHYSLAVFGDTLDEVTKNMASAKTSLQDGPGYKVSFIDVVPEAAWFAQLPGNFWLRPRSATLSSLNFASMSPFHNFATGKRDFNPWGQAVALFKTPSGQPFYFNFHPSPLKKNSIGEKLPGNTVVLGTTGVGKTTTVMALLAFLTKVKGMRAVFFDKDRGGEIAIRVMGGKYRALKYGEATGFNPFQWEPSELNISFCKRIVEMLIRGTDEEPEKLTSKEMEDISLAVDLIFKEMPHEMRRLGTVFQNLPNDTENSLAQRLSRWVGDGDRAWVLDNPEDTTNFSGNSLFGFDYTEFLDRPEVRTPIMAYLLHVTQTLIDGQPFVFFMEEFWKPLMDDYFKDFALNKQKTIRKESGLGVFLTQSPSDVLTSSIGKTMVEQSVTQIFLPNPRADHDEYVEEFKLTEQEFRILINLQENSRMFLIKQNGRSAVVQFDLGGMPDVIDVLSGSTDNVMLLDTLMEEYGEDPKIWLPHFHKRIKDRKLAAIEHSR
ncbi:MAG: VirB4 family type IV secretion/conjugal transfer ATPase [Cellvibrionaceae bacterium]